MFSKQLLKGNLQTIILQLLADHQRMYGYEITQRVQELSEGKLILTEGALYPTLHKLEKEGLVVTEKETVGKRVRKYYRLTPQGEGVKASKLAEFQEFMQVMTTLLGLKPGLK